MTKEEIDSKVDDFVRVLGIDRDEMRESLLDLKRDYIRLAVDGGGDGDTVVKNIEIIEVLTSII